MSDRPPAKIRLRDVVLSFGDNRVLDGVDLEILEGRSTVLIGGAATGKSVLMKCILELHRPDSGVIEVDGRDTVSLRGRERFELWDRFGVLFQQGGLFDSLTVWENIAFKLMNVHGMDRGAARRIALEKLSNVGLAEEVGNLYPADLSGGMQKRVGLARAMAGDPEILLLDNPTAGLDPITSNQINALMMRNVRELGATLFAITADMEAARTQYDYLAMIHDGRIIWYGPTGAIDKADNPYLHQLITGSSEGPIKMRVFSRE